MIQTKCALDVRIVSNYNDKRVKTTYPTLSQNDCHCESFKEKGVIFTYRDIEMPQKVIITIPIH